MYRILPSVSHRPFQPYTGNSLVSFSDDQLDLTPNQLRWDPFLIASGPHDFVDGLKLVCRAGSPEVRSGLAVYVYTAIQGMGQRALNNSDGDFLIGNMLL